MNLDNFGVIEVTLKDLSYHAEYNWANYPWVLYGRLQRKDIRWIQDLIW